MQSKPPIDGEFLVGQSAPLAERKSVNQNRGRAEQPDASPDHSRMPFHGP